MFNEFIKRIFDMVSEAIEKLIELENQLNENEKKFRNSDITAKTLNERKAEIKAQQSEITVGFNREIEATREEFIQAVRESELVDGSMIDDDAKLFSSGIKLTEDQIQHLIDKHRNNAFMIQLCREYCQKNHIFCNLPLSAKGKIDSFTSYCNSGRYSISAPHSIQAGCFLAGKYNPELDEDQPIEDADE